MYRRRSASGDLERAMPLVDAVLEQFERLGMKGWTERACALRADCGGLADVKPVEREAVQELPLPSGGAAIETEISPGAALLRREDDYWTVACGRVTTRLRDVKGLQYLSQLLRHPGREFHALDLVRMQTGSAGAEARSDTGLPVLDAQAKAAYRRRFEELRAELDEAESFNDNGRAKSAREEMEAIGEQLAAAVGLGGRDRETASAAERARSAVTQRVRAAIKRIAQQHPALADHLVGRIETGTFCMYRPDPMRPIEWKLD